MSESHELRLASRPMSTIALKFSAALDDLFNLGPVDDLKETVDQKNREVESQKTQLEELDAKLRQTDEQLKKLELKHKRMSRQQAGRPSIQDFFHDTNHIDTDRTNISSSAVNT